MFSWKKNKQGDGAKALLSAQEQARRRMSTAWMCGHAVSLSEAHRVERFHSLLAQKPFLWFNQASCAAFAAGALMGVVGGASASSWIAIGSGSYGASCLAFLGILTMAHQEAAGILREQAGKWISAVADLGRSPEEASEMLAVALAKNQKDWASEPSAALKFIAAAHKTLRGEDGSPKGFIKARRSAMGELCLRFALWSSDRMAFGKKAALSRKIDEELHEQDQIDACQSALPEAMALHESREIAMGMKSLEPRPRTTGLRI